MSRVRKNAASLLLLQGANYLLPLATVPYLVRVLGPEYYGRIAFAQAFIQYFVVLADYGFNLSATRSIARASEDREAVSRIFNAVLGVKCITMLLGFAVMSAIVNLVPPMREHYELFAVSYLAVVGNALFPVWLYQGLQRMAYITAFTIAARSVVVLGIFLLVQRQDQYLLAAALLGAGMPLAAAPALWAAMRVAGIAFAWPRIDAMRQAIIDGWHVFTATFGGALYNSSNTFVLGLVAPPAVVGYFAAADKLLKALQSLIYPFSQAAFPHVAALLKRSEEDAFTFVGRLLRLFGAGALLVALALAFGADRITYLVFGSQYAPTADLLRILSPWPLLIALNVIFGALFIVQLNLGRLLSVSILMPAAIHILFLYPIARLMGMEGVAVLMLLTELFVLLIRVVVLYRTHRRQLRLISSGMFGLPL